ncbi:MAG TPA: hypothetical protein VMV54_04305 [Acidocella sp.]|nr:hypothetical protein [Acidocella sp.]
MSGLTASVPRRMGQPMEPVLPRLVGHSAVVRPGPGWAVIRVQVTPSGDW